MRLPFLHSKEEPAPERRRGAVDTSTDRPLDAAQARTRARQRLVGALVLLAVGVIGFPILFETQPRPLPVDTPIEIVRRDGGVSVSPAPAAAGTVKPVSLPPPDAGIEATPGMPEVTTSPAPALQASQAASPALAPAASQPAFAATPRASAPVAAPTKPASAGSTRERAPAAPASAPTAAPAQAAPPATPLATQAGRFVVQAGAYLDATSLRDARQKVEKLGLKTYTQVVETPTGKRTRVRIGPFESRAEADSVAARIKATGLSVVVLTL